MIDRKVYWKTIIAFGCPLNGDRHTVEDCFNKCEFSGTSCHDNAAWIKCGVDPNGERELHNGKVTRDN